MSSTRKATLVRSFLAGVRWCIVLTPLFYAGELQAGPHRCVSLSYADGKVVITNGCRRPITYRLCIDNALSNYRCPAHIKTTQSGMPWRPSHGGSQYVTYQIDPTRHFAYFTGNLGSGRHSTIPVAPGASEVESRAYVATCYGDQIPLDWAPGAGRDLGAIRHRLMEHYRCGDSLLGAYDNKELSVRNRVPPS